MISLLFSVDRSFAENVSKDGPDDLKEYRRRVANCNILRRIFAESNSGFGQG
jgi:hypothetical protein